MTRMNHRRHQSIKININCQMIAIARVLLLLLPVVAQNTHSTYRERDAHRIFPAAKIESYNPQNLPPILGILSSRDNISFVTTSHEVDDTSANENATNKNTTESSHGGRESHTKNIEGILEEAFARFRNSLKRYPDFRDDYPVNPKDLSLVPIEAPFFIDLKSSNVSLYHGVPEDYEIHISLSSTPGDHFSAQDSDDRHVNTESFSNFNEYNPKENRSIKVFLKATTVFGVLRALETLGQLLEFGWMDRGSNDANGDAFFVVRDLPLSISDEPSFPYRGLMIDTARHYLPMDLILDNLDAMAMNKMNVLHWHISDSQSFPYAPKDLEELAQKGAYHPKRIYTPHDVSTIVREAYLRGIRVIPEIDMPGHTNAIAASHPEVMSHCPDPSEPMNPTVPETYEFISRVYEDLNTIFPDNMVHLGGDEVQLSEACWLKDASIAKWMSDHGMGNRTVKLYEYFETHLLESISGFGKTPIVWQEVFNLNLTIPKDTIIDVWKGFDRNTIQNATNQGHRVILSGCWYLDHLDQTWDKFYECDPLNFTSSNKDLMIGGHASMWGEHCDASNFISRVWPRASSAAERLWHGTSDEKAGVTIEQRIHNFRCRMVLMGFAAGPTGPGVCPTEVAYSRRRATDIVERTRYREVFY